MTGGTDKLKQMEEEMDRFEAEIAHQVSTSSVVTPITGGFTFPSATSFMPPQLRITHLPPPVQPAYSVLPMPPGVSMYMSLSQPPLQCFQVPQATLPTNHVYMPPKPINPTVHAKPDQAVSTTENKPQPEIIPVQKVITAPPQMAGPNELAARAKEAAAVAVAAKSKTQDDDDDVTRALLAAAAGVTYTRIQGPDGKEKVLANITKPPLTPVVSQTNSKAKANDVETCKQSQVVLLPPPAVPSIYRSVSTATNANNQGFKKKKFVRTAAGSIWEDPTLAEWDPNDFRIFCGDLGNEVGDDTLARAFNRYSSFQKAKVVRDKRTGKSRGYGFVSFSDPEDFTRAMREMNGKYVGNRPIKLKKSEWRNRQLEAHRKREKEKKKLGLKN